METITQDRLRKLQRFAIGFGFALAALALLADVFGISAKGLSRGQMLGILVGLLIAGIGILGKKTIDLYRATAILLLNTVVLLVCIEIAAGFAQKIDSRLFPEEDPPPPTRTEPKDKWDYYTAQPWGETYWNESELMDVEYAPYVIWKQKPFSGETINIDENGFRITPNAECGNDSFTVFMFGGSTMWGYGSPDWASIPAYMQQSLITELDQPVCVRNFGETAFASTQELLLLLFELRAGNIPDVVIFYDGINDTYGAYQAGEATHQNQQRIVEKLYAEDVQEDFGERLGDELAQHSYAFELLRNWFDNPDQAPAPSRLLTYKTMGVAADDLARQVVDVYLGNYGVVEELAAAYGFDFYFFWQPALIIKSEALLTDNEKTILETLVTDPARIELYRAIDALIQDADSQYPQLFDISDAFNDADYWIDDMHVIPEGNRVVADRMLAVLDLE